MSKEEVEKKGFDEGKGPEGCGGCEGGFRNHVGRGGWAWGDGCIREWRRTMFVATGEWM